MLGAALTCLFVSFCFALFCLYGDLLFPYVSSELFLFFWFSIAPKMYIEISVAVFREMSYYVDIICFCYVLGYLIIILDIEKGQK